MNRTGLKPRVTARCVLLAGITGLGLSVSCWAAQPYMDDSNETVPAADGATSTQEHLYPRIYAHENFGGLSAQALSKYQFIDIHGTGFDTIGALVSFAPDTMVLRQISGRAYQGWAQSDPCHVTMGVAFAGTGPVSEGGPEAAGCNIFAGHWLYKAGSPLSAPVTASALTLQVGECRKVRGRPVCRDLRRPRGFFQERGTRTGHGAKPLRPIPLH